MLHQRCSPQSMCSSQIAEQLFPVKYIDINSPAMNIQRIKCKSHHLEYIHIRVKVVMRP